MSDYSTEHKVPPYGIRRMVNTDPGFYDAVGPFLAKRDVARDLGASVWDDSGKEWYVAVSEGIAIGMVALWRNTVCSFWVAPRTRGQTVGYALLRRLMADVPAETTLHATATDDSLDLFAAVGFTETRTRGRYHVCVRIGLTALPPNQPGPLRGVASVQP